MEFMVNKQTGERIPTAGITLYADLPVGSWVKNDMGTIPYGFLKEGDTISQSEYPELYAKYGSTVPYMADTSELSDYAISITFEQITAGYTMPYDGVLSLGANSTSGSTIAYLTINGERVVNLGVTSYTGTTVNFRKGDVVRAYDITTNNYILKVAYYTKSLIVKAKNVGVPADIIEGVKNSADTTPTLNSTNLITSGGVYNALNNQMVVEEYAAARTVYAGYDVAFSFSGTKAGYTPICWDFYHGYSTVVMAGIENVTILNGSFEIGGFARGYEQSGSHDVQFLLRVVWLKNI